MSNRKSLSVTAAVLAVAVPLSPVTAQTISLEEIVVTAERRERNLQTTPLAVTALSELQMERRNITETIDLGRQVPLLIAYNNVTLGASLAYWLRGIGSTESLATFDPPVLTYVDEVANPRQNANNLELVEIERMEILRGPQGTLFGRNTTGGAVNIVTKKPNNEFEARGEIGYGRFDEIRVKGSVNIPITDKFLTKWSAFYLEDNGWQKSVVNDENFNFAEHFGLRGAIRVLPADNITWDMSVNWSTQDHQNLQSPVDPVASNTNLAEGKQGPWLFNGSPRFQGVFLNNCKTGDEPLDWVRNNCTANETTSYDIYSNLIIDMDSFSIGFITGYRNLNHDFVSPLFARTPELPLSNDGDHNMYSQELKLTGDALDGRLSYVSGFFYMKEDNLSRFETSLMFAPNTIPIVLNDNTMENDTESFAWYAQGDYEVVDNLTFTAGIRWTDERKHIPFYFHTNDAGVTFDIDDIVATGTPDKVTAIQWTPRFVLQYQINDDMMVFASATRGFKSGGWNGRAGQARLMTRFEEETVWSYEIGTRSEWLDNRLRFNATLFDVTYSELQLPSLAFQPAPGEAPTFVNNNAGELNVRGAELEVSAVLAEGLNVYTNIGLQDAKYNEITPGARASGFILGVTVPQRAPEYTIQAGFDYSTYMDNLTGDLTFAADFQVTDDYWMSGQNPPDSFNDGFETVNASISWDHEDGTWGIQFGCKNCLDERYVTTDFLDARFIGDPLRWSIRFKYAFN